MERFKGRLVHIEDDLARDWIPLWLLPDLLALEQLLRNHAEFQELYPE